MPSSSRRTRPPELLAPAGGHPQLRAAIEAGADAVYFGLSRFNARARAANFHEDELPCVMGLLHERGVRGFAALNTLVFDDEMADAMGYVEAAARAGVDAVIVQDLGLLARIREDFPDLPIHASTQMTLTSVGSVAAAADLGARRVVLGRELSVAEIRDVVASTPLEVEVFVHGALCLSYGGQCLSSEAWGGRSANRGRCAQSCRLPWGLVVDGQVRDMGDAAYPMSPQDLLGIRHLPALLDAGVAALKIEGRLKGPEYVAATTRAYRAAVDAAWRGEEFHFDEAMERDLAQVFSRGQGPGWLDGPRHQGIVAGRFPGHRGVRVGRVVDVERRGVRVLLEGPVAPGDGLVFDAGRPGGDEIGGTVHTVLVDGEPVAGGAGQGEVLLRFGPKVRISAVGLGDRVWRTRDPALEARLRPLWEGGVQRRVPLDARVSGRAGEPLELVLRDREGRQARATTDGLLEAARGRRLDEASLRLALDRLGTTPYSLESLDVVLEGDLFLPVSELNRVRRAAVEALTGRRRSERVPVVLAKEGPRARSGLTAGALLPHLPDGPPALTLLCRSREQVMAALDLEGLDEIAIDLPKKAARRDAIRAVQAAGRAAIVASQRVFKPDEKKAIESLLGLGADGILVRSLGLLHGLLASRDRPLPPLLGDFSLNAANARTIRLLLGAGLARIAPAHDLDGDQVLALAGIDRAFGGRLELILHHHMPLFHTEHCVFARFLSDADDRQGCGQPCQRHEVHLRGEDGRDHLVQADADCRNTVYCGQAQSGMGLLPGLLSAGVRRFRVELIDHRRGEVATLVGIYQAALRGGLEPDEAWRRLSAGRFEPTEGSLRVRQEPGLVKVPGWRRRGDSPA